jgi:heme exporter protein A
VPARPNPLPTRTATAALELDSVTRRFGRRWALRGVSLSVAAGEIVGLEGHNGSGKSTLLRIAATALRPTTGSVVIYGTPVQEAPDRARALVGLLSFQPGLYDDLTARENLLFASRMLDLAAPDISGVLERVGLLTEADERVRTFSSGMQRRLSLGRLLLQSPKILLLDEPYNSFDRQGVQLVNEVVLAVRDAGGCALIVLHDRHIAEGILDRVVRLRQGLTDSAPMGGAPEARVIHDVAGATA